MNARRRPDFFIVGAFKCGTTSLYEYLRQHPQIFMPFHKEPLFFGDDLTRRYGRMTQDQYLDLFASARSEQRVGEASSWYLYSKSAAQEIAAFAPTAQIIIMLRNPVDVMYAQHSQLRYNVEEDLVDFAQALAAESARHRGERLPAGPLRVENLFYRESVRFPEQVERYLRLFGRERVHVILYEDLRDRTLETYGGVLEFLRVDRGFVPKMGIRNPNKEVRHPRIQRMVYQPPTPIVRLVPVLRRFPIVHRLRESVLRMNSSPARRAQMDPDLRHRLLLEQAGAIKELARVIDRDLSAWLAAVR